MGALTNSAQPRHQGPPMIFVNTGSLLIRKSSPAAAGQVCLNPQTGAAMSNPHSLHADPVEELRLRRWARENYVPLVRRDRTWHAIVLDEMQRKDQELAAAETYSEIARRIVPLFPEEGASLRGPHIEPARTNVLLRVPVV